MTPSWRKPVGALGIVVLVVVWCVLVASCSRLVGQWPVWAQTVFYLLAGTVWITPLKPALRWMETGRFR